MRLSTNKNDNNLSSVPILYLLKLHYNEQIKSTTHEYGNNELIVLCGWEKIDIWWLEIANIKFQMIHLTRQQFTAAIFFICRS